MGMVGQGVHECCDGSEMDHHEQAGAADCVMLSFCEQVVDSPQSDTPAVMQHIKSLVVAELTDEIETQPLETDYPVPHRDKSVTDYNAPPLFLMNSAFLN